MLGTSLTVFSNELSSSKLSVALGESPPRSAPPASMKPRMMMTRRMATFRTAKQLFMIIPPLRDSKCIRTQAVMAAIAIAMMAPLSSSADFLEPLAFMMNVPKTKAFPERLPSATKAIP